MFGLFKKTSSSSNSGHDLHDGPSKVTFLKTIVSFLSPANYHPHHADCDLSPLELKRVTRRYFWASHLAWASNISGWTLFLAGTVFSRATAHASFLTVKGGVAPDELLWIGWGEACTSGGSCTTWDWWSPNRMTPPAAWKPELSSSVRYLVPAMHSHVLVTLICLFICFLYHWLYVRMPRQSQRDVLTKNYIGLIVRWISKIPKCQWIGKLALRRDVQGANVATNVAQLIVTVEVSWVQASKTSSLGVMMHASDIGLFVILMPWVVCAAYASYNLRTLQGPWTSKRDWFEENEKENLPSRMNGGGDYQQSRYPTTGGGGSQAPPPYS